MKLKTMGRTFKKYGKNLTIFVNKKAISFPKISYARPKRVVFRSELKFEEVLDKRIFRFKSHFGIHDGSKL